MSNERDMMDHADWIDPDLPGVDLSPLTIAELANAQRMARYRQAREALTEGPMPELVERRFLLRAWYFAIAGWVIATIFGIYHGGAWLAGFAR